MKLIEAVERHKIDLVVVDLDGTLIRTDLLIEAAITYLKANPLHLFAVFLWALRGPVYLKNKLINFYTIRVETLPYRQELLAELKLLHEKKIKLILVTASPDAIAKRIAQYLNIFSNALGTTADTNLKGIHKLNRIKQEFPNTRFAYVGDATADIVIWKESAIAVAINPNSTVENALSVHQEKILVKEPSRLFRGLIKQLRPHQWIKNALIFAPLIAAHRIGDMLILTNALIGFVSFSFAASAVYIFNDVFDLEADRNHRSKRDRPLASGMIHINHGLALLILLVIGSLALAIRVDINFLGLILLYFFINLLYTLKLKKEIVVDILIFAGMYTLRIFAGSSATNIVVSPWLLSFSIFFFFSLACVKRFTELSKHQVTLDSSGRGYRGIDGQTIFALGVGSGLVSLLVLALYFNSNDVVKYYSSASNLWFFLPLMLYWISRLWILTGRGEVHDDPVLFAIKDRRSWAVLVLAALILFSASRA